MSKAKWRGGGRISSEADQLVSSKYEGKEGSKRERGRGVKMSM